MDVGSITAYSSGLSESLSIGELFRSLRERSRMSQADVERGGGPKQSLQSRIERGDIKTVSEDTIRSYAQALGMSLEKLRHRIEGAKQGQTTELLRLGFIHGISAAPIIAMLMDAQLGPIIAASMKDENGQLCWSERGVAPDTKKPDTKRIELQGPSLQAELDQFDLVVASADRLAGFWKEGGPLLRYAQISSQAAFDFMIFGPPGTLVSELIKYDIVTEKYNGHDVKTLYLPGTLGEDYASELVKPDLQPTILAPFETQIPEQINGFLKGPGPTLFRAIVPFPMSANIEQDAKGQNWEVRRVGIDEVFEKNEKSDAPVRRYSIDILLRRDSQEVIEWLNGDDYDRFSDLLNAYEDRLSPGILRPMHGIVMNIAAYLGIDAHSCTEKLKKCPFNLMHYPEFTRFLLNVRTTRRIT